MRSLALVDRTTFEVAIVVNGDGERRHRLAAPSARRVNRQAARGDEGADERPEARSSPVPWMTQRRALPPAAVILEAHAQ
jgi:hypothetical protein